MSQAHLALGSSLCTGWWLVPSDEVHQLRCADIGPWFRYSLDVVAASWHSRFPSKCMRNAGMRSHLSRNVALCAEVECEGFSPPVTWSLLSFNPAK
jgi:hypothetical protein